MSRYNPSQLGELTHRGVDVTWYGAKGDGVTDDTAAFQAAINATQSSRQKLIVPLTPNGYLITSELVISQSVWIEGVGPSQGNGGNTSAPSVKLIFSNSAVDGNGNSTQACMRVTGAGDYKTNGMVLKNLAIQHTANVKNQHSIILQSAQISYSEWNNLTFMNATGYGIAINGGYMQNIYWNNFSFYNVGGCIGRIDGSTALVATLGQLTNFNLDQSINSTSPQAYVYDFAGFRHVEIDSILAEGSLASSISIRGFRFGGTDTKPTTCSVRNLWLEFSSSTQPTYAIELVSEGVYEFTGVNGVTNTVPVYLNGNQIILKVNNFYAYGVDLNKAFTFSSGSVATVIVNGAIVEFFTPISSVNLGKIQVKDALSIYSGNQVEMSTAKGKSLYSYPGGFLQSNRVITFAGVGYHLENMDMYTDATEGRCLHLYCGTYEANFSMSFNLPAEYVGTSIVVGVRYLCNNATSNINLLYTNAANYATYQNNVKGAWTNGYIIIRNAPQSFVVRAYGNSGATDTYISDLQVNLGTEVPFLASMFGSSQVLNMYYSSLPTSGAWLQGDRIHNTAPTAGGTDGWICTTAGTACGTTWASGTTYSVGQQVAYNGNVYSVTTAGASNSTVAPANETSPGADGYQWSLVGAQALFKTFGTIGA